MTPTPAPRSEEPPDRAAIPPHAASGPGAPRGSARAIKPRRCYHCKALFTPPTPRGRRCDACAPACPVCSGPSDRKGQRCHECAGIRLTDALVDGHTRYTEDVACQLFVATFTEGATLESIGEALGLTRERVRQIEAVAIEAFSRRLRLVGIDEDDLAAALRRRSEGWPWK